ncbi:MAG: hypothetical protein ACTSSB_10375 [Candidatus Heimdallarchaeota archaeon]
MDTVVEDEGIIEEVEEGQLDVLDLEIHKEEKDTKPPASVGKIVLIFAVITLVLAGITIGVAKILDVALDSDFYDFAGYLDVMFLIAGAFGIFSMGISGFWGGQRNIPIRMVSPADSSVVGVGLMVCGYIIEKCIDNEVELTIYGKDKEVLYEEVLAVDEDGLFFTEIQEEIATGKKTKHIEVECWFVSEKSKAVKFIRKTKKLEELNVANPGLKIGNVHFFPRLRQDFSDKVSAVYDPRRQEKGVISDVDVGGGKTMNVFFPGKNTADEYVPFTLDRIAKMKLNAFYFDLRRKRRSLYVLLFLCMAVIMFMYPLIRAIIAA